MSNRVVMAGRLVHEPELKATADGTEVVNFRIAVPRKFDKDKADFFEVVAWRKTAVFLCSYFHKGDGVEVDGQLQSRQYQTKDGFNRTVVEIVAENVDFPLGRSKQTLNGDDSNIHNDSLPGGNERSRVDELNNMTDDTPSPVDDDLPF